MVEGKKFPWMTLKKLNSTMTAIGVMAEPKVTQNSFQHFPIIGEHVVIIFVAP